MAKKIEPKKKKANSKKSKAKASASSGGVKEKPWLFQKGQSGNPEGGRAHDPELRELKTLTKKELVDVGNIIVKGDVANLKKIAADESATVLQRMLASVTARIISKGDMQALDVLLNRLVGKVKDEVKLGGELNLPQVIVTLPSNRKEAS